MEIKAPTTCAQLEEAINDLFHHVATYKQAYMFTSRGPEGFVTYAIGSKDENSTAPLIEEAWKQCLRMHKEGKSVVVWRRSPTLSLDDKGRTKLSYRALFMESL